MLKFKIESDKFADLKLRASISDDLKDNLIIKRVLFESKIIKSNKQYPYIIPIKYIIPIIKNLPNDMIESGEGSITSFLEFSDEYEEQFYYAAKANARYMKNWREEGCPKIYKIMITDSFEIQKKVAFEKI